MTTTERPRRPVLTAGQLVLVIVAVLATLAVMATLLVALPPLRRAAAPELPVRNYLQAIVSGHVSRALALARITPHASDLLLTDAAYRRASDRVSSFAVLDTRLNGDAAQVRVELHQGKASYDAEFAVQRDAGFPGLSPWRLQPQSLPQVGVVVHGPQELPLSVGGSLVSARGGTVTLAALPGTYAVSAEGPGDYAAPGGSVTATFATARLPATELVAALQPAGVAAVQSAVDAWLARCAQSAEMHPDGCPFSALPQPGVVYSGGKWTIDVEPTIGEGDWSDQLRGWPVRTVREGAVTFTAHATVGRSSGTATTGSNPFGVAGTVVADPATGIRFVPAASYSNGSASGPSV